MKTIGSNFKRRTGQCRSLFAKLGCSVAMLALFLGFVPSAPAQLSTADIVGTVTDPTGAVVSGATVTLLNLNTQDKRTAQSSGSGDYQFNLLPVGRYTVTVTVSGFKTSTTSALSVEAGDRARSDIKLQTGGQSETVNVEAQTPLLQADNATVSSTVTAQSVQDLPLNGRNFVQLVQLVPGANEGPGNGLTSGGRPDDRRFSSSFSVNGQDDTLNNTTIDGIDDNERVIGTIAVKPNVEGIQEISVQTNSYSAEAGRTAGGVVNIVTRAGTNQFHGSAYEFFRNDIFDARNVLQTTGRKPELRQNQFGGSIGGPIFRDRTFFFGDYEGFRQVTGLTYTSTVPTIDEYNNINSIGGGSPGALIAAGNGTGGNAIDPVALNYLKLFPAPNTGAAGLLTNNYIVSPNRTQNSNIFDVRVDHKFSDNNLFFGRYNYNKVDTFTPQALGTAPNGIQVSGGRYNFAGPSTSTAQQYGFGLTHIFTQNLLVDLRAAYTRLNNLSLPLNYGTNPGTTVGFGPNMNFNALSSFLTPVAIGPFADVGDGAYIPLQDIDNTFQYLANFSYTKGNHNLKFGFSYIRRQARNLQSNFAAGQYGFNLSTDNCVPGTTFDAAKNNCGTSAGVSNTASNKQRQDNQIASTLVGAFTSDSRNYNLNTPDFRSYEPSGFIQDSWKVSPRLTLVYGIRYDVFTPFTEAHSHISNFDFNQALGSTSANVNSALKIANVNGVDGHAGLKVDYSNVAPRVGFSAALTPGTVLRGGYGISYFPGNYTSNASLKNVPFVSVFSPNCQSSLAVRIQQNNGQSLGNIGGNGDCASVAGAPTTFDQGLPVPTAPNVSNLSAVPSLSFIADDPNLRSALVQQFNLQVQQQFGANVLTIGYVGNIGQHLPQVFNDVNMPKPFNPATSTGARPLAVKLPTLSSVGIVATQGYSNYNGLQTSFQRRFTKGLAFDANYTWGKAMSNITGFSEEGQQGWGDADPTRVSTLEYGNAENDIRNRFALSLNYQLQYGKNFTGIRKQAFAGWQVNTITVWQSGKPFTIINGGNGPFGQGYNNHAVPFNSPGPDRPNQIGDPNMAQKTNAMFFNTAAFQQQPLGTIGNTARNSLYGPHFRHIDLSLFKDFPIKERLNLQFRAEAYNISNTPNFYIQNNTGNANTQVGSTTFGQVTQYDPNYTPRLFQFALKAQF